jgi:hypothetical protein
LNDDEAGAALDLGNHVCRQWIWVQRETLLAEMQVAGDALLRWLGREGLSTESVIKEIGEAITIWIVSQS